MSRATRLRPHSKLAAQKVNHGSINREKGFSTNPQANFKQKAACVRQLLRGELVPIRRECLAEWRDGFRLINANLAECVHISESTLWIRANQRICDTYEKAIILCLKGNSEIYPSHIGAGKDKEFFFEFDGKGARYGDRKGQYVDMAAPKRKK